MPDHCEFLDVSKGIIAANSISRTFSIKKKVIFAIELY